MEVQITLDGYKQPINISVYCRHRESAICWLIQITELCILVPKFLPLYYIVVAPDLVVEMRKIEQVLVAAQ